MKIINLKTENGSRAAIFEGGGAYVTKFSVEEIIRGGTRLLKEISLKELPFVKEEDIKYAPAVEFPEKLLCVGLNYFEHSGECGEKAPDEPVIFGKYNNSLAAHNEEITLLSAAKQYDYEAELAIIIGKTARNVPKSDALSYIFGYTCANDFSARDLQFKSSQWLLGKAFDGSAPLGPKIVTADELDPQDLDIFCRLNGETRQKANTSQMMFSCAEIISFISRTITLKPCDVILTGTPPGVILGREEKQWIKAGDEVEVEIENIGILKNTFV